jgi:hypothetical protein
MKKRAKGGMPAVFDEASIPASEAWLYRNVEALQSVTRGIQDLAAGKSESLGSFARFAADERQR